MAPIEVRVIGPNLKRLHEIGLQLRKILQSIPHVTHTRESISLGLPKLQIVPNEDRLGQLRLTLNDLTQDLSTQLNGVTAGSLQQGPEEIPVVVRIKDSHRQSFNAIDHYYFTPGVALQKHEVGLPLLSIAKRQVIPSSATITHFNTKRANTISGFIDSGVLPQEPLDAFKKALKTQNFSLPHGYYLKYGGEASERSEAMGNLFAKVNVIIVAMIIVLVLTFNSFLYMLLITLVGAQALGLGVLSLYLLHFPLGFVSMIGIMGLLGVAINAGIIIIANLRYNRRAKYGDPAAMSRVITHHCARHIIATTVTTILGFLPLMFTPGDLWRPFAAAFIGGMAFTTIVSFFFVPSVYRLMSKNPHRVKNG